MSLSQCTLPQFSPECLLGRVLPWIEVLVAFAGEGKETWGEVRLGGESYPGKSQSPTLRPNGRSGAEQGPQKGPWRAWASLGDPSIPSLMPICDICTAGGSSGLALWLGPTAPRFGGLWPDQLWKPRGVAGSSPEELLSPAAQAKLGLLSPHSSPWSHSLVASSTLGEVKLFSSAV